MTNMKIIRCTRAVTIRDSGANPPRGRAEGRSPGQVTYRKICLSTPSTTAGRWGSEAIVELCKNTITLKSYVESCQTIFGSPGG